ncbi:hypothetical protein [Allocoleopsis sp.]|uniref:hypothetical protein n=1 Tax=Allocoleopsis sp. TaxID=3088169 RepID=UPI002FD47067
MQLSDLANQHNLSLDSLQIELLNEFPDVEQWDEIPDSAMPKVQELLNKAPEIKEMAHAFALPAASDNGSGSNRNNGNENGHLPKAEALTIAQEYGVSTDFVYAVKNADIQLQLDAETEFKSGIAEAELLIAAKEAGKALVYEAYDENRDLERQQKLNQIQSLKANGLDFLRQKYGVNPGARASKANERLTQIQQGLAESNVDVKAFFVKK